MVPSNLSWFLRNQGSCAKAGVDTAEHEFPKVSRTKGVQNRSCTRLCVLVRHTDGSLVWGTAKNPLPSVRVRFSVLDEDLYGLCVRACVTKNPLPSVRVRFSVLDEDLYGLCVLENMTTTFKVTWEMNQFLLFLLWWSCLILLLVQLICFPDSHNFELSNRKQAARVLFAQKMAEIIVGAIQPCPLLKVEGVPA
jgi:hypothetical protein